jgi:hypothetical protein
MRLHGAAALRVSLTWRFPPWLHLKPGAFLSKKFREKQELRIVFLLRGKSSETLGNPPTTASPSLSNAAEYTVIPNHRQAFVFPKIQTPRTVYIELMRGFVNDIR